MIDQAEKKDILLMRPFMPSIEEFNPYLNRMWETRQLTNDGPLHKEFEEALSKYLGVEHICLFANGTLALLFALKALELEGEVITTPFTSIATLQAIHWANLKPVFVDIDKYDLNIVPELIEDAITTDTCAIVPVHVFGNPCDVYKIKDIAQRYNLKTIYDAAHCFGVTIDQIPLCDFGDLSVLSFHATKVFNSFEGGAVVCHDEKVKEKLNSLKILRLDDDYNNSGHGLNAKMNEIQGSFWNYSIKPH